MFIHTNLTRLRESLEQVSLVESLLLNIFEHLPIGLLIVEYPSRKCILINETCKREISSLLVGEKLYIHPDYIVNEKGQKIPCLKVGSFSFAIGDKQYLSYILASPKKDTKEVQPTNGQQSSVWV